MIKSKLLLRYGIYGLAISILFLIVAHLTTRIMIQFSEFERHRLGGGPFSMIEAFLNNTPPSERKTFLEKFRESNPNDWMIQDIVLLDSEGHVLFSTGSTNGRTPMQTFQLQGEPRQQLQVFMRGPTPGSTRGPGGGPPRFGGPPPGPPGGFWKIYSIQALSLIGAVLLTVFIMISTLRGKARVVEQIIQELARGNLKARFPVSHMDEVGQMMFSFNKMADEIEHLIEHLRKVESVRRDLIRELAHDLRTPIASMKTLIETAASPSQQINDEKRRELLGLAQREVDYFAGLVEDLLFLGRVSEPRYKTNISRLNLSELIKVELESAVLVESDLRFRFESSPVDVHFEGDADLLRRLFRNVIQNAVSFAKSEVAVSIVENAKEVRIRIRDDGKGFSQVALATFGQKKFSRTITETEGGRISIGLGSVIMKSIVDSYRGRLKAENHVRSDGAVAGAAVEISLPRI